MHKCAGECNFSREGKKRFATSRDRTSDLQIFSLTLSQLSYRGYSKL